MASEYLPLLGGVSGLCALLTSVEAGFGSTMSTVIAVGVAIGVIAAWWYSPLPNRSIFVVGDTPLGSNESGYWGFSRDQDE